MSVGGVFQQQQPQQLAFQELLLRNPQLLQQFQQQQLQGLSQGQIQQQEAGSLNLNPQQAAQLKQNVQTILQGSQQLHQHLQQLWQATTHIMNCFNAMCNYASELEKVAILAQVTNQLSNAFLQERDAALHMNDVLHEMLSRPDYLLLHSFQTWDRNLGIDNQSLGFISELYMELVQRFEERHRQATGNYTPRHNEYLQQQINQPQQQGQRPGLPNQANQIEYIKQFSGAMQNGSMNVGKQLIRQHAQARGY